jgi:hypothetical protein
MFPPLNEPFVYPGHPLVLAYLIVNLYPTYESALAHPPLLFQPARVCAQLPGAGWNIRAACDLLEKLHKGEDWYTLVFQADAWWTHWTGGDLTMKARLQAGLDQAAWARSRLLALAGWWTSVHMDALNKGPRT